METPIHKAITACAIKNIPNWANRFWVKELPDLCGIYSMYSDLYKKAKAKRLDPLALPDFILEQQPPYEELKRYCIIDGIEALHAIAKDRKTLVSFVNTYLDFLIRSIDDKKSEKAAKYVGVFSHFLGDVSSPAHAYETDFNNELFLLFNQEQNKKYFFPLFHATVETGDIPVDPYKYDIPTLKISLKHKPGLMGLTIEEAVFNIVESIYKINELTRYEAIPIAEAFITSNRKKVRQIMKEGITKAAEILTDYIYTAFCIAHKRFKDEEKRQLSKIYVEELYPLKKTASHPVYRGFFTKNFSLGGYDGFGWPKTPIKLLTSKGIRVFKRGLGMGAPYEITYSLPQGVYKKFSSIIGVHFDLGQAKESYFDRRFRIGISKGRVKFVIKLDNKVVFESKIMESQSMAQKVEIALGKAQELTLSVKSAIDENWNAHALWANPIVYK